MNSTGAMAVWPLGLALVLAGCSTTASQDRRIEANRLEYESWPLETRQAVLDGRIEPEMTPTMVRVALGNPGEIVERTVAGRTEVVWIYTKVETVAPAAPQMANATPPVRTAAVNGSNAGGGASLPAVAYREREIVFFDGVVVKAGRPL